MKNILLIVNPVSGKQKLQGKLDDIVKVFEDANLNVTTVVTEYRGHAAKLSETAFVDGFDTIVCCGGDGTLNEVFTGLIKSGHNKDMLLGYLPCGSTNDFADTLGLDIDPIKQAKRIVQCNEKAMDVGSFGSDKYFCYIACFGAFSDSSYSAPQKLKNRVGHLAYILEGFKDFWHIKPTVGKITVDGQSFEGRFAFGSVSNTKSVAGLIKLKDDVVNLEDGLFEVILVRYPKNIFNLIKILYMAETSKFTSDEFVLIRAKEIKCEFESDIPFSLDGEKADGGKEVIIMNLSKSIRLLK